MKNNIFVKILTVILSILFIVLSIAAFGSGVLKYVILNKDFYENISYSNEFTTNAKASIDEKLEIDCKVYTFPYEGISSSISKNEIGTCVAKQIDALFSDDSSQVFELKNLFDSKIVYDATTNYIKNMSDPGLFANEKNVTLLSEKVAERVNLIIESPFSQSLFQRAVTFVFNNKSLDFAKSLFPVLFIASIIILVLLLIIKRYEFSNGMYLTSSLFFAISTLLFIPIAYIRSKGIGARIALSDEYLKNLINCIFKGIMDKMFYASLLLFFLAALYLIVSVIIKTIKHGRKFVE